MIKKAYTKHFSHHEWIFFVVAAAIYTIIYSFYLPGADDFNYAYVRGSDNHERLTKLWQIIPSNIYGYMEINGRFFTHCVVQLLILLGGGWWLYLSSGIVFGLLLFMLTLLHRLYRGNHAINTADKYLIALLTLFLVPNLGGNYLGNTACTVNYLWGSAAAAFMLLCHQYFSTHPSHAAMRQHWWLLPLAFVAATWNESFGISVTGALVIYTLFNLRRTNRNTWWLLAVLCAGVLFAVASPGNIQRFISEVINSSKATDFSPATLLYKFTGLLPYIIKRVTAIMFTIAVCFISITIDLFRHKRIVFLRQHCILFLVSLIIMLFALFVTFFGPYMMNVASVVAALQGAAFWRHYIKPMSTTVTTIAKVVAVAIMAFDIIPGSIARSENHRAWLTVEDKILSEKENIKYIDISPIMEVDDRYFNTISTHFSYFYFWFAEYYGDSTSTQFYPFYDYYGIPQVVALPVPPSDIPKIAVAENRISDSLYLLPGYDHSYMLAVPSDIAYTNPYAHLRGKALRPIDKAKDFLRHRDSRTFPVKLLELTHIRYYDNEGGVTYLFIPASYTFHRQLLSIELNHNME